MSSHPPSDAYLYWGAWPTIDDDEASFIDDTEQELQKIYQRRGELFDPRGIIATEDIT